MGAADVWHRETVNWMREGETRRTGGSREQGFPFISGKGVEGLCPGTGS